MNAYNQHQYRKKPVVIEAFQFQRRNNGPIPYPEWYDDAVTRNDIILRNTGKWGDPTQPAYCEIKTLEGVMRAEEGDWIIRGIKGEIYPCRDDIFAASYEAERATQPADGKASNSADSSDTFGDKWHSLTCDGTCSPPCKAAVVSGGGQDLSALILALDCPDTSRYGVSKAVGYEQGWDECRRAAAALAQDQVAAVRAVPETHSARRIITQLETAERGFICPLCGKDFPHGHTPAEISIYRNGFKAAIHQQELIGAEHQGVAEDARVDSGAVSTGGGAGSNECNEHRGRKSENNRSDGGSDGAFDGVQSSGEVRKTVVAPSPQPELSGSIDSNQYFGKLLSRVAEYGFDGGHDNALIEFINAWKNAACAVAAQDKTDYANQCIEACEKWRHRATDAEAKLAAIRRPDAQIIQRAGEIFGFKPHEMVELVKSQYLDFARWAAGEE